MTITTAELLAELTAAMAKVPTAADAGIPPNTYSGPEIRAAMQWGAETFATKMRQLIAAGLAVPCRIRKLAIDGRVATVVAYRFLRPPKVATIATRTKGRRAA